MPSKKNKCPRFDKHQRLLNRFFEPLFLLLALGKTRGEHFPGPVEGNSKQSIRRKFFNNIAYLCDYTKGGDSTSAIGIEECDDCYNFWIASNQTSTEIRDFVEQSLSEIRYHLSLEQSLRSEDAQRFIHKCIAFAQPRINKEAKILSNVFKKCIRYLEQGQSNDIELVKWIQSFDLKDNVALCERAYETRKAPEMKELTDRGKTEGDESEVSDRAAYFQSARHLLGRLGHHVRAPKQILEDAPKLGELLSQNYFVRQIPLCKSVAAPEPDGLTTLESMLGRMLPANASNLGGYKDALLNLDRQLNLQERVINQYKTKTFQPQVHAEIQVLEYFYSKDLRFIDDDRYINCSKPACYCCHLYIRHHPLGVVEPASHKNIYPNWGPHFLPEGMNDPGYRHQLNMLQKMLETIRKEALAQIKSKAHGPRGHRDTTTGITSSTKSDSGQQAQALQSIDQKLERLNIATATATSTVAATTAAGKNDSDPSLPETVKADEGSSTSSDGQSSSPSSELEEDSDSDTINGDGDSDRGGGAQL